MKVPSFISSKPEEPARTEAIQETVRQAREGSKAIEDLIASRDSAVRAANVLQQHFHTHNALIEKLEGQVTDLEGKLAYYINLSASLITRLTTVGTVVDEAIRSAREAAMSGRQLADVKPEPLPPMPSPSQEISQKEQEALADLAKRLSPNPNPEPIK